MTHRQGVYDIRGCICLEFAPLSGSRPNILSRSYDMVLDNKPTSIFVGVFGSIASTGRGE